LILNSTDALVSMSGSEAEADLIVMVNLAVWLAVAGIVRSIGKTPSAFCGA